MVPEVLPQSLTWRQSEQRARIVSAPTTTSGSVTTTREPWPRRRHDRLHSQLALAQQTSTTRIRDGDSLRLVERRLQRPDVAVAGVGRARHRLNIRTLRGQRLLNQDRYHLLVDFLVDIVAVR
jgi:hypothetical protein